MCGTRIFHAPQAPFHNFRLACPDELVVKQLRLHPVQLVYTDTHTSSLRVRVPQKSLSRTHQHISVCWGCSKMVIPHDKHIPYRMHLTEFRWQSSDFSFAIHRVQNVFFMWNHDFRASSAERYMLMCVMKLFVVPSASGRTRVYMCIYAKSRKISSRRLKSFQNRF